MRLKVYIPYQVVRITEFFVSAQNTIVENDKEKKFLVTPWNTLTGANPRNATVKVRIKQTYTPQQFTNEKHDENNIQQQQNLSRKKIVLCISKKRKSNFTGFLYFGTTCGQQPPQQKQQKFTFNYILRNDVNERKHEHRVVSGDYACIHLELSEFCFFLSQNASLLMYWARFMGVHTKLYAISNNAWI